MGSGPWRWQALHAELLLHAQPHSDPKHMEVLERSYGTISGELVRASAEFKTRSRQFTPKDDGSDAGPGAGAAVSAYGTSFAAVPAPTSGRSAQAQAQGSASGQDVVIEMKGFGEVDMAILQERNADALAIAQESKQLNATFQDLAVLVEEQHEQIQDIDKNVDSGLSKVQRGNEHLEEALTLQAAARRKNCCILGIVLIVALAIVLPIVFTQSGSS